MYLMFGFGADPAEILRRSNEQFGLSLETVAPLEDCEKAMEIEADSSFGTSEPHVVIEMNIVA